MATIYGSTNNSNWTHKLEVVENSTNVGSNTSSVTVTAYIGRASSGSYMYGASISCSIGVTGCSNQSINYYNSNRVDVSGGGWLNIGSTTFNVPHDVDGSKWISVSSSFSNNVNPSSGSASGGMWLTKISRQANITNAPNFNDEESPTISYSNSAGNSVSSLQACISLTGSKDDIKYRDISKNGSQYTFNLTKDERNVLRSACTDSNSRNVIFFVKTEIGNNTYYSTLTKTLTIVNANPTFADFTFKDTNDLVTSITGDNQILVKGLSTLEVDISPSDKMVANKKATEKSYLTTIDTANVSTTYSSDDLKINVGSVNATGKLRLNVRAYDSRNNSTLVYKDVHVYDYSIPNLNASIIRLNNFENQTTLSVKGEYTRLTINDTDKNTINSVVYRYRETNGKWSEWTSLTYKIKDGEFVCNDTILSLDNVKSFEFEVKVVDKLSTNTQKLTVDVGQAIFFVSSNKKACYINGNIVPYFTIEETWDE